MEFNVFLPIEQTFLHSSELFKARPQVAEFAEVCRRPHVLVGALFPFEWGLPSELSATLHEIY